MRKQQEKLLNRAQEQGFSQDQVDVLSREDIIVPVLETVFNYLTTQNEHNLDKTLTAKEANKWIDFVITKKAEGKIADSDRFRWLVAKFLPNYPDKDTLLGDSCKHKLWRAYQAIDAWSKKNRDGEMAAPERYLLYLYKEMLYDGTPISYVRQLIRKSVENEYVCGKIVTTLQNYPCLFDDYNHNGQNSLLWQLIENGIVGDFSPDFDTLASLYSYDNHKFCFDVMDFKNYFYQNYTRHWIEDKLSIADIKRHQYPITDVVIDFCDSHQMKRWNADEYDRRTFYKWTKWQLWDESQITKLKECHKLLGRCFKTSLGAWSLTVSMSPNCFTSIKYREYLDIVFDGNDYYADGWHTEKSFKEIDLFITPDGKIFETLGNRRSKQKNIPISMGSFLHYVETKNLFGDLLNAILNFHSSKNGFFKDVIADVKQCYCLMPLTFNDVCDHYNRAHYLNSKYKLSNKLNVNWNKQNLNLSYYIIKAYPWVEPGISQQILLQQKDVLLLDHIPGTFDNRVDEKTKCFLTSVIMQNVYETENRERKKLAEQVKHKYDQEIREEVKTDLLEDELNMWLNEKVADEMKVSDLRRDVFDYVRMCRQTKAKIRLDVRSVRQLENLHDAMADGRGLHRTETGVVKIPKKSQFLKLRKILPDQFEWIKTRKRLVLETELQHHCVWSYARKITDDKCAIYSFVDKTGEFGIDGKPKRYTVEFAVNSKGKYTIVQVQGKYDRAHTELMKAHIQSILDKAQEKKD